MTKQKADFSSAQALTGRAKHNYEEFRSCTGGDALWRIEETHYPATSDWGYTLRLNRAMVTKIERIVADCAVNLTGALDHLAAALARSNGHDRLTYLYYPFGVDQTKYKESWKKTRNSLVGYENVLTTAHKKYENYVQHVAAAKELSNTSKHWAFLPPTASSPAVAWQVPQVGQKIANIPADTFVASDSFEFHRGSERLNQTPMNIVIMLSLTGLQSQIQSPDTILECALRYVEGVISEVSAKIV